MGLKEELEKAKNYFRLYDKKINIHDTYIVKGTGRNRSIEKVSAKSMTENKERLSRFKRGCYLISSWPTWDIAYSFMWQLLNQKENEIRKNNIKVKIVTLKDVIRHKIFLGENKDPWAADKEKAKFASDIMWVVGISEKTVKDWVRENVMELLSSGSSKIYVLTVQSYLPVPFSYEFGRDFYIINLGYVNMIELQDKQPIKI
jgi:hypothetical protein